MCGKTDLAGSSCIHGLRGLRDRCHVAIPASDAPNLRRKFQVNSNNLFNFSSVDSSVEIVRTVVSILCEALTRSLA